MKSLIEIDYQLIIKIVLLIKVFKNIAEKKITIELILILKINESFCLRERKKRF